MLSALAAAQRRAIPAASAHLSWLLAGAVQAALIDDATALSATLLEHGYRIRAPQIPRAGAPGVVLH